MELYILTIIMDYIESVVIFRIYNGNSSLSVLKLYFSKIFISVFWAFIENMPGYP